MSDDGYDYDDEYDDEYYELFDDVENLADELVGTAWGHDPPYQPDGYDAYDTDEWEYDDSGEDEYFDGPLNTPDSTSPSSPTTTIKATTMSGNSTKTKASRLELEIQKAMKGKKFYGESPPPERNPRKRRKIESHEKGIMSLNVGREEGEEGEEGPNGVEVALKDKPSPSEGVIAGGTQDIPSSKIPSLTTQFPENNKQTVTLTTSPTSPVPLPILGTAKKPKHIETSPTMSTVSPLSTPLSTNPFKPNSAITMTSKKAQNPLKLDKTAEISGANGNTGHISPRKRKATPLSSLKK